jgi:hypothetical protein|tara:strand:- start:5865 stop:6131 length:267 start_codon:yes stop_codon:yes gene_type:complete
MNIEERKNENRELRRNAPIPDEVEDLRGITWRNKYNSSVITITQSTTTDTGNVFWLADVGGVYSTRDINNHWVRLEEEEYWVSLEEEE